MMVLMTGEPLRVALAELRESFDVLLRHGEATAGTEVTLDKEYFWSVPFHLVRLADVLRAIGHDL
ncbi:hypothetical protein [Streptomyces monomycini]|uniref:hypothetical protein n=1 Tax=Streptomyces monomycini TaxID=371720 RepID=UPI001AD82F71|nr:hypothetical protein [Streptomyces monomycini]